MSVAPPPQSPSRREAGDLVEAGLVGLGGAVGSVARALVARLPASLDLPVSVATQCVNLTGALALGALLAWLEARGPRPRWHAFLAVGLLGSFTTFSALVDEGRGIARATSPGVALLFLAASLGSGIAVFHAGQLAGARVLRARPGSTRRGATGK